MMLGETDNNNMIWFILFNPLNTFVSIRLPSAVDRLLYEWVYAHVEILYLGKCQKEKKTQVNISIIKRLKCKKFLRICVFFLCICTASVDRSNKDILFTSYNT